MSLNSTIPDDSSSLGQARKPKVSIGLPVYNGEKYLRNALDSILGQSYRDFELIISDNASTDGTRNICESYAKADKRIQYIFNEKNIGAAPNYNRVFDLSSGEYFKWAAHDDICSPGFLKSCVEILDNDNTVVLCHPTEIAIDEDGEVIPEYMQKYAPLQHTSSKSVFRRFYDLSCRRHGCFQVFGLVRSSVLKSTPRIANFIGSDRVLLAHLALFGRFVMSREPIYFRRHSEQYCALGSDADKVNWFDTANTRSTAKERRNFIEYLRSISNSALPNSDRLLCYMVMLAWLWKKRRRIWGIG